MTDKVDRKAVHRRHDDCEEAHALYAAHGVSGAEGARMMSEAAQGLTDLLAEVERLREGWAREDLDEAFEAGRKEGYEEADGRIEELEAESESALAIIAAQRAEVLKLREERHALLAEVDRLREALEQSLDSLVFAQAELKVQAHIPDADAAILQRRIDLVRDVLAQTPTPQEGEE